MVQVCKRLGVQLGNGNPQLASAAAQLIDNRAEAIIASLRKPYWERKDLPELREDLEAEAFVKNLQVDKLFKQALTSFAKDQARVQILGMHAVIRAYKWEYNRLPN